ncbi:hypothetical protein [Peterkaempfera bronchialis]|uniref:hypothetical protein n=1 Tax=Peterkaempfera bronchialis TaxID=2126346 RepID=UPI0013B45052|nr:hypothetical protein [Peterkaempfera bronchialis]
MEPLTEHRPLHSPVVYGFLHLVRAPVSRHAALAQALAEYCRRHELLLAGVFTERHRPEDASSPAFTGLLDVLAMSGTYGVVLPTASHLGPRPVVRARSDRIAAAGTRLLLVRRCGPGHRIGPSYTDPGQSAPRGSSM